MSGENCLQVPSDFSARQMDADISQNKIPVCACVYPFAHDKKKQGKGQKWKGKNKMEMSDRESKRKNDTEMHAEPGKYTGNIYFLYFAPSPGQHTLILLLWYVIILCKYSIVRQVKERQKLAKDHGKSIIAE